MSVEDAFLLAISPFQAKIKLDFLDQPASGRDAIAIEKIDRFPVFFYRLERAYIVMTAPVHPPHIHLRRLLPPLHPLPQP
jgi:hypothetical protein